MWCEAWEILNLQLLQCLRLGKKKIELELDIQLKKKKKIGS